MPSSKSAKSGSFLDGFWAWYERHYTLNLGIATGLFVLQLVHLYWLATHVIAHRILGIFLFEPSALLQYLIIIVDYTEIPALISTSVLYIYQLQKHFSWKSVLFLIFLNSQWLHLFWITDEFVVNQFVGRPDTILPVWLAWVAILIDYLEVPVIIDTLIKFFFQLRKRGFQAGLKTIAERD
jgi:hypothetical protein